MKVRAAERFNRWTYSSGGKSYDDWPETWKAATRSNAATICAEIDLGTGERVLTPEQVRRISHPVLGLRGTSRNIPKFDCSPICGDLYLANYRL